MKHLTAVFLLMTALNYASAQQQPVCNPYPKTITVTGTSEMEIIPDEIYVQVDLREYKKKGDEKVDIEVIKAEFLGNPLWALNKAKPPSLGSSLPSAIFFLASIKY